LINNELQITTPVLKDTVLVNSVGKFRKRGKSFSNPLFSYLIKDFYGFVNKSFSNRVNFEIPDYWGIGKLVSRGFGTVKRVSS